MRDTIARRLRIRAWRRGTKEMDLILGPYADAYLDHMDAEALSRFEALMEENDQDLYQWVSGARIAPERHAALIAEIARHARDRLAGSRDVRTI